MAKYLADLLANDHPLFSHTIKELESASGNSGIDTKLIGDITRQAHEVIRALGLDPADTSAHELYRALNAVIEMGQLSTLGNTQHILLSLDDGLVSFNLLDVIENAHHELSFESRMLGHAQRSLRLEVVRRYAEHDRTDNELVHAMTRHAQIHNDDDVQYADIYHRLAAGMQANDRPRILAIGDIFTDAFIKLSEDVARVDTEPDGSKRLSIPFGSKPPYERVDIVRAVGPSPNAAVAFSRLNLDASLLAWLGDDEAGKDAVRYLNEQHVSTDSIVRQPQTLTNYYYVLRLGAERTILVKNETYRYEWKIPVVTPDWVYLSLISEDSWQLHEDLLSYLAVNQAIKLAFQPGTFHFKWGVEKLRPIYERSHIVVMNREEAVEVTGKSYDSLQDLTSALHNMGPKIVVITDGPNGSYASYDNRLMTIPNYPDPAPAVDRTGAGDAFASTIVAALAQGKSMDEALLWAPVNSMNVVQNLGAQAGLLTGSEIQRLLEAAPLDYKVRQLEA